MTDSEEEREEGMEEDKEERINRLLVCLSGQLASFLVHQLPLSSHCLNTQRANPELVKAEEMMKKSMEAYERAINGLSAT